MGADDGGGGVDGEGRCRGGRGFNSGRGGSIEPPKTWGGGGLRNKGSIDRTIDQLLRNWALKITSKRVVRSSAGAYAIYPPFLGSFAYNTPRYGTGCPTPCKIIILGEKMIPQ